METDSTDRYPHRPLEKRDPDDHSAAVSAFYRLYQYGRKTGKPALAVFAVYKALQKLDREGNSIPEDDDYPALRPGRIELPAWVHAGIWFSMQSFLLKPNQPKVARFVNALRREWREHRRWLAVVNYRLEHSVLPDAAVNKLTEKQPNGLGARSTLLGAYHYVEEMLKDANTQTFLDEKNEELAQIESRDLLPTRYLRSIFTSFEKPK